MHFPIALLLLAFSSDAPAVPTPTFVDTGSLATPVSAPSATQVSPMESTVDDGRGGRPDASTQMLYSSLGGGLGIVGGGLLGGMIGANMSSDNDSWEAIGNVIIGVGAGMLVGGTTGATWGAYLARPKGRSRSLVPTALGGLGGMVFGFVVGSAIYGAMEPDNAAAAVVCVLVIPALGAGAGATAIDQLNAPAARSITGTHSSSTLAFAPWMPRKGLLGMRMTIPTGI